MRRDVVLALFLASTSGLFAAIGAYNWMPKSPVRTLALAPPPALELTTVVVAKADMAFGASVLSESLEEAQWPVANVPEGSFKTIADLMQEQSNRVVLETIRGKEPVLRGKVSGPGQRATLSSMLGQGMKAVSIKVNEVVGVSGFVLPGDYVDVLLIVEEREADDRKKPKLPAFSDLLLERVRVLAVDQSYDPKQDQPKTGSTVTVEVGLADAQKIALAQTVGKLSLVLRATATLDTERRPRRLVMDDLGDSGDKGFVPSNAVAEEAPAVPTSTGKLDEEENRPAMAKVNVVRSVESSEYSVTRVTP